MGKNPYIHTQRGCGRTASLRATVFGSLRYYGALVAPLMLFFIADEGFCQLWSCSDPLRISIAQAIEQDKIHEADSLFTANETACVFGANDLMKWMRIKTVLGKYGDVGRIACKTLGQGARVAFVLQFQLIEALREAPSDTLLAVLRQYGRCALSMEHADTASIRQWLAGACFRFGLYDEELRVLRDMDCKKRPSAGEILECASRRFFQNLSLQTIAAARLAYERCPDPASQSSCALMLYQSYARVEKNDSAALWLGRAALNNPQARAEAVAFFQQSGYPAKADSLMAALGPSFTKDTLAVRGMLFAGNFKAASNRCEKLAGVYTGKDAQDQLRLWRVRALLFAGSPAAAQALLDSIHFSPAMAGAYALASFKYALRGIRKAPAAGEVLGALVYAAWTKRPQRAAAALQSAVIKQLPDDVRQLLIAEGLTTLIAGKLWPEARSAVENAGDSLLLSELRYYRGVILLNLGEIDAGRAVFEDLLLRRPADVFSQRARTLMSDEFVDKTSQKQ